MSILVKVNVKNKNNMSNLSISQKENGVVSDKIIELKNPNKTKHTVQPAFDPSTRWYAGIPRMADSEKSGTGFFTDEKSRITLYDGITFDLTKDADQKNWEWLKHLKEIAPDFETYRKSPTATFYVFMEGRESEENNKKSAKTLEAQNLVWEDSPTNYEDRALLLGADMTGEKPAVIKEYLIEMAKDYKTAGKVIEVYKSNSLSLQLLYLKAKRKGVITEMDGIIKYGLQILGTSDLAAIACLQEPSNKGMVDLIDQETNPEYYSEKIERDKKEADITKTKK